jgi:iron uptake system component EfeO
VGALRSLHCGLRTGTRRANRRLAQRLQRFSRHRGEIVRFQCTDVEAETDALVDHLDSLYGKLHDMPLTRQGLLDGTVRLAYEVGESKADGGESRISGTSLDDMRNNVAGIDFAYRAIFAAPLKSADGKLAGAVDGRIEQLKTIVAVPDLQRVDIPSLRRASEELVVALQNASTKLGLQRPTLEAASQ